MKAQIISVLLTFVSQVLAQSLVHRSHLVHRFTGVTYLVVQLNQTIQLKVLDQLEVVMIIPYVPLTFECLFSCSRKPPL